MGDLWRSHTASPKFSARDGEFLFRGGTSCERVRAARPHQRFDRHYWIRALAAPRYSLFASDDTIPDYSGCIFGARGRQIICGTEQVRGHWLHQRKSVQRPNTLVLSTLSARTPHNGLGPTSLRPVRCLNFTMFDSWTRLTQYLLTPNPSISRQQRKAETGNMMRQGTMRHDPDRSILL